MYGLSLIAVYYYVVMLMSEVFGWRNDEQQAVKGLIPLVVSFAVFYFFYYLFFWNFLGRFGITYFSPQALINTGGTGLELWNARENSSLAILYLITAFIWVTVLWNAGMGNSPWEGLSKRVAGLSKFFATAAISAVIYSVLFHPHITALFLPKQIFAGVLPWWEGAAMTSSAFYHLGWMFGGLFIILFLMDCLDGFPFKQLRESYPNLSWLTGLLAVAVALAGGFLFMYVSQAIMNHFWYEAFTGGSYTDDPRFRHVHTAEIAAFFMLALMVIKIFFNNIIQQINFWLAGLVRLISITAVGMLFYWFYYSEVLGPKYVDRVSGIGNIDETSLCWTIMSLAVILVYDRFFNAYPLRR